jgi:DNA-binding transcriptional LysR family regulator
MNSVQLTAVDLNLLVVFEAVFTERHVGTAAGRLRVTPSAVSHGLRRLRELFDDPLFLRAPKGVIPSARAVELAGPIAEILSRVRSVVGSVERFDPAVSARRFTVGAVDSTWAVLLPRLTTALSHAAPRIDLAIHHLLPATGLDQLDQGKNDLVVVAVDDVPARFSSKVMWEEEFVIAARAGHPFLKKPSLRGYCELRHVLVSITGESHGFLDQALEAKGLSRRVALTVPNFLLALAALVDSDFVAAIPSSLITTYAARFGIDSVKTPVVLRRWQLRAVVPKVSLADAGIAWLFEAVARAARAPRPGRAKRN